MRKAFILFIILLPFSGLAQFTLSGRVVNRADSNPVTGASVFINNTTIVITTTDDGTFTLKNLTPGKYKLVVSLIGYETKKQEVTINQNSLNLGDISLSPKTVALNEVKVTVKQDPFRQEHYSIFKDQFFGTSDYAQQCTILNPEVLDLDYNEFTGTLTASSSDFLEIENDALGYKVKYLLDNFTYINKDITNQVIQFKGDVSFEPLTGTPSQQRRWERNRQDDYANSETHFFQSVLAGQVDEEGFRVLKISYYKNPERPSDSLIAQKISFFKAQKSQYPNSRDSLSYWNKKSSLPPILHKLIPQSLKAEDLISNSGEPGLYKFGSVNEALYVTYDKDRHFLNPPRVSPFLSDRRNTENTLIAFNSPYALINANGAVKNPFDMSYDGVWVRRRVAELLPVDYRMPMLKVQQVVHTQNDSVVISRNLKALQNYALARPVEKIHLHLDRQLYFPGDTIWFKAYLTQGEYHKLSDLSRIVYAELIDQKDSVVTRLLLKTEAGTAPGDFELPYTIEPGAYRIRAYTNYMRNAGPDYFYDQPVKVAAFTEKGDALAVKPSLAVSKSAAPQNTGKIDLQFFPEGGGLINGLRSKVAFKAINQNGQSVGVQGTVTDSEGNEVATFGTQHLGMGAFPLEPQKGRQYFVKGKAADGSAFTVPLPQAKDEGYTLSVNANLGDSLYVKVTAGKVSDTTCYIIAQVDGKYYFTAECRLTDKVFTATIPKSRFPSGVVQFTLFAQTGEPLNERIVFIQNPDQLDLTLNTDKKVYTPGEKVKINLDAITGKGEPAIGNFSVSVTDETRVPVNETAESTIFTDLLLKSELGGNIENPNYYFISPTDQTKADLDLLLLTQGYRRFEWKEILDHKMPETAYKPEKLFSVAGTVKAGGKPVPGANVSLASIKQMLALDTIADANGSFEFNNLNISDTAKLYLRAGKGSKNEIDIKQPDYPLIGKISYSDTGTSKIRPEVMAEMKKQFEENYAGLKKGIMLKQVDIKSTNNPLHIVPLAHSDNLNGAGHADQVIMGDELVGCPDLSWCLISLVKGARVYYLNEVTPLICSMHTPIELNRPTSPMMVSLDGIVTDQSALTMVNASDVYSIEILETRGYLTVYGTKAASGLIVITTKNGTERHSEVSVAPGLTTYTFKGYYKARQFYSPKYDANKAADLADRRRTIYWSPTINTDATGKASFEYFNAGSKGNYRMVVEGIDSEGNLARQVLTYRVDLVE